MATPAKPAPRPAAPARPTPPAAGHLGVTAPASSRVAPAQVKTAVAGALKAQAKPVAKPVATKPAANDTVSAALLAFYEKQAAANATAQANQAAVQTIEQTLASYGFSGATLQAMVNFTNHEIVAGKSPAQISLDLQQTSWFQNQFPAINERVKAGLPPITPAEYLSTKDAMTQTLVAAGISPATVNLDNLIARDVSATELSDRIQQGYLAVAMAPQDVVSAFHNYYGVTRGELAQYFLDPKATEASLLRKATAAQIGGAAAGSGFMGATQGSGKFPVDLTLANQLAAQGVTYQQAQQGFAQLATESQLYNRLPGQQMARQFSVPQLAEAQFEGGPAAQQLALAAQAQKAYFEQGTQVGQSGQQTAAGALQR